MTVQLPLAAVASPAALGAVRALCRVGSAPSAPIVPAAATSTAALPLLIGDFERIFPFDDATAAASDTLATPAAAAAAQQRLQAGKTAAASAPASASGAASPLVLANFTRTVISSLKLRMRERDRLAADHRRLREADSSLPLRQSFVPSIAAPSPWTPQTLQEAVQRARKAAQSERNRSGIAEPEVKEATAAQEVAEATDTDTAQERYPTSAAQDDSTAADGEQKAEMRDEGRTLQATLNQEKQQQMQQQQQQQQQLAQEEQQASSAAAL